MNIAFIEVKSVEIDDNKSRMDQCKKKRGKNHSSRVIVKTLQSYQTRMSAFGSMSRDLEPNFL